MKFETIFNIFYKDINNFDKPMKGSKEITLLGRKYFINEEFARKEKNVEMHFNHDFSDGVIENMASLNIEGIATTKAVSTKSKEFASKNINRNIERGAAITHEWAKEQSNLLKGDALKYYSEIKNKTIVSKNDFLSDIGLNLASEIVEIGLPGKFDKDSLLFLYQNMTFFQETLDPEDKIKFGKYYRTGNVDITDGFNVIDKGDDFKKLDDIMDMWFDIPKNESLNSIWNRDLISIMKFLFVEIHPYFDGNGRMSRLLMRLFLANTNDHATSIHSINMVIKYLQNSYYKAIRVTRNTNDLTYFILFMQYVYMSIESANVVVNEKNDELMQGENKMKLSSTDYYVILYYFTQSKGYVSWKDLQKNVIPLRDLSEQRVKQILNDLVKHGILTEYKIGKTNHYQLSDWSLETSGFLLKNRS